MMSADCAPILPVIAAFQMNCSHPSTLGLSARCATVFLLLSLVLSGCDETPPEKPTVRFWESHVGAAERFIRAHHTFDLILMNDALRYAEDVINEQPIWSSHFMHVMKSEPRTYKPLYIFSEALEGAYLTDQDKIYLERLQAQLDKARETKRGEIAKKLREHYASEKREGYMSEVEALSADFMGMPTLMRAIDNLNSDNLKHFAMEIHDSMNSKFVDPAVILAFFLRTEIIVSYISRIRRQSVVLLLMYQVRMSKACPRKIRVPDIGWSDR